jgi:hypothetical protein
MYECMYSYMTERTRALPGSMSFTSLPLAPLPLSEPRSSFSALLRDQREELHDILKQSKMYIYGIQNTHKHTHTHRRFVLTLTHARTNAHIHNTHAPWLFVLVLIGFLAATCTPSSRLLLCLVYLLALSPGRAPALACALQTVEAQKAVSYIHTYM